MDVIIDVTDTVIETDRLILRAWRETDLDDFYAYACVPGVGEMAGWNHHDSIGTSQKVLQLFLSGKNVLAIVHKEKKKVIGSLGFHDSWANDEPEFAKLKVKEIGYVLSKEYWGGGLMPGAVRAVIGHCFTVWGLDALTIGHFTTNSRSKRVIEKCGFTFVKESKYYSKQMQKTFDDLKYILRR